MAGTIRPNEMNVSTTPVLSSKTLPDIALLKSESKKPAVPRAPRVDIEPLYSTIKSSISDSEWTTYKTSLTSFLLGNLNQDELSQRLDRILTTPALEHAHNSFMMGIYANMWRDAPEPGVANWVSSSAKPSSNVPKGTGDESEKRLKHEVMQLSRRERKRIKTLHQGTNAGPDAPWAVGDGLGSVMQEYHEARRAKMPESGPTSAAGGYGKTNWDLEIRKRYTSSLFIETHEFPTATTISHRLLPICYESGLASGHTPDCADYMNIATETYIKEALTSFFQLVRANGANYIRTADFKKRVDRDEARVERGELQRVAGGELPVEAEERRRRPPMCMEDLRLALLLGDGYLGQVPLIAGAISNSRCLDTPGVEDVYDAPSSSTSTSTTSGVQSKPATAAVAAVANGIPATNGVNGAAAPGRRGGGGGDAHANHTAREHAWTVDLGDAMVLDEEHTWQGGSVKDIDDMDVALDSVLELGNL